MSELDGWIPIGIDWTGSEPQVDWCYFDGLRFTEPFFENTMQRATGQPYRVMFRRKTSMETLERRAEMHPGIAPTGFIFHMSRCGSTLISQMLAASDRNIVISEGWPMDAAINADLRHPEVTSEQRVRWLQGMVRALGQTRAEHRYFIKFDATHTLDLPLIRTAFPDVPWIFLYRDPVEVMISQVQRRASWTMPGLAPIRGMRLTVAAIAEPKEHIADLLALICEAARRGIEDRPGGMLLNYDQLPGAVGAELGGHFHCEWSDDEMQKMQDAAKRDAKRPEIAFSADSDGKQREAGEQIREICERKLGAIYRRLEAKRNNQ